MNRYQTWITTVVFAVLFSLVATSAPAQDAETWAADYELLTNWEFSDNAVALPAGGIHLENDTAEWFLETGTVRPMRPTSGGSVTGLVFEGEGRFRMAIPDKVEAGQVARFAMTPAAAMRRTELPPTKTLEYTFRRMVLRTTDDRVTGLFPPAPEGAFNKNKLATERHRWWLWRARFDADARVIAGLLNGDREYLAIDMETDEQGWLFYEFDGWRMEEIRFCRMAKSFDFVEVWVSLDRAEHRRPDGRPGSARTPLIDLINADLEVDLMKHKGRAGLEISRNKGYRREAPVTFFRAKMECESLEDDLRAVPLRLYPYSRKVTAADSRGRELPVLRAPIGKRISMVDQKEEDIFLVVILHEPLAKGERVLLDFTWQRQTGNYPGGYISSPYRDGGGQDWYPPFTHQSGRYWYPEPPEGRDDRHTARVTVVHPKDLGVRASGAMTASRTDGKRQIDTWVSATPIKYASWTYGHGFEERRILRDGLPEIIGFGPNKIQKLGDTVAIATAHMADSVSFFQETLDYPLPLKTVTGAKAGGEPNSAAGFITYGSTIFGLTSSWDSEWAMAKGTAELFWGELLDWESYRDSWLADSLAGYSAMMFLEVLTENWDFRKKGAVKDYDDLIRLRQRRLAYGSPHRYDRLGPLDVGFRDRIPGVSSGGYNRSRGLAVLNMLRGILRNRSGNGQEQFNAILSDFLKTHAGETVSTRDFIATVNRQTGEDWGWFFDQWVYRTEVPTYGWSHTLAEEPDTDGLYLLEISMNQQGVAPDFRMPVTFGLEYRNAKPELLQFQMDQPSKTHTVRLPFRPVKVTFDPNHDLLYTKE